MEYVAAKAIREVARSKEDEVCLGESHVIWNRRVDWQARKEAVLYIDHDEYVTARVMSVWSRQFVEVIEFLVDGEKHMIEVTVIKRRCLAASGWRTRQNRRDHSHPSLLIAQALPGERLHLVGG